MVMEPLRNPKAHSRASFLVVKSSPFKLISVDRTNSSASTTQRYYGIRADCITFHALLSALIFYLLHLTYYDDRLKLSHVSFLYEKNEHLFSSIFTWFPMKNILSLLLFLVMNNCSVFHKNVPIRWKSNRKWTSGLKNYAARTPFFNFKSFLMIHFIKVWSVSS